MDESKQHLPAQLSLAPQQVSKPIIQALFNTELVRKNYRKVLQGLSGMKPTRDNLKEVYAKLKEVEAVTAEMEKFRKSVSDPYFKTQKDIKATFDEIMLPILSEVNSLKSAIKIINDELSAELAAAAIERNRVSKIKDGMVEFINNATRFIADATDDTQLVTIQKRIGSEKARTGFYQEYMDDFKAKCDSLTTLVNQRKETIKRGKELLNEQKKAIDDGDVELASIIKGELEVLDDFMEENVLRIQEKAFEQVSQMEVEVAEPILDTIKGRKLWKWRVDDVISLYRKHPELVQLVPDKEKIDALLAEKRKDGSLEGVEELKVNGVTFYIQKNI